jgi:hypothetical protein
VAEPDEGTTWETHAERWLSNTGTPIPRIRIAGEAASKSAAKIISDRRVY